MWIGMNEFDHSILELLNAAVKKPLKIQAWMGIQTLTSAMQVQWSTSWARLRPTVQSTFQIQGILLYYHHPSPHWWAYNQPTQQTAPSWPDSSTDRALHWHRRGQVFNPCSGLKFSVLSHCCLSSAKIWWLNSFITITTIIITITT